MRWMAWYLSSLGEGFRGGAHGDGKGVRTFEEVEEAGVWLTHGEDSSWAWDFHIYW